MAGLADINGHECNVQKTFNRTGDAHDDFGAGVTKWETWTDYHCSVCGAYQHSGPMTTHSGPLGCA